MAGAIRIKVAYPVHTTLIDGEGLPWCIGHQTKYPSVMFELVKVLRQPPPTPPGTMKKKKVQTMYRDSETQTDPFDVDIIEPENKELEILTLGWLSWNHGLPAGMHEIEMIERARQRRAWEKAVPVPINDDAKEIRRLVISQIEINEWSYREEEIEFLNSMRMELAEKMMQEQQLEKETKLMKRLQKLAAAKLEEKTRKIQRTRNDVSRAIRKLKWARNKVQKKYHVLNIVKEHSDKKSELWGPQERFGEHPKRWHEVIHPSCRYLNVFKETEILVQQPSHIPDLPRIPFDYQRLSKPRVYSKFLCIRETKWTPEKLERLYNDLKKIRLQRFEKLKPCRLKQRIPVPPPRVETPSVEGIPNWQEDCFQAQLVLQKFVKGRAIQTVMFEGRVRCQELIEEIKSTHAVLKSMEEIKAQIRVRIYTEQREMETKNIHECKKQEILRSLSGKTNADILDFLAKELLRLQNERLTHAFALLADRERHRREAAEAGRRQEEEQRRREHDEMFKQVVKMYQNTVDVYLENVILETKHWLAEREAREYIHNVAKKVDQAAHEAHMRAKDIEDEEMIGDLVFNYMLPEAKKNIVRDRLKRKQRNYLKTCHDEVYTNIEKLAAGPRDQYGLLVSIPRPAKVKLPRQLPIKVLRLKRQTSLDGDDDIMDLKKKTVEADADDVWSTGFSKQDVVIPSERSIPSL